MDITSIEVPIPDTPEGRRMAAQSFADAEREGLPIPKNVLRVVARMVRENLDVFAPMPANRPPRSREELFLAWFAVECDPAFADLARTRDKRFSAVGALLACDPTKVQRDARAFAENRRGTDSTFILLQGERYARAKALPWPDSAHTFLDWYHARPVRRKKSK